jgi:hypothetical protein
MKHFKAACGSGCDARRLSTRLSIRGEAESCSDVIMRLAAGERSHRG